MVTTIRKKRNLVSRAISFQVKSQKLGSATAFFLVTRWVALLLGSGLFLRFFAGFLGYHILRGARRCQILKQRKKHPLFWRAMWQLSSKILRCLIVLHTLHISSHIPVRITLHLNNVACGNGSMVYNEAISAWHLTIKKWDLSKILGHYKRVHANRS